jgi:hypothetical protein
MGEKYSEIQRYLRRIEKKDISIDEIKRSIACQFNPQMELINETNIHSG